MSGSVTSSLSSVHALDSCRDWALMCLEAGPEFLSLCKPDQARALCHGGFCASVCWPLIEAGECGTTLRAFYAVSHPQAAGRSHDMLHAAQTRAMYTAGFFAYVGWHELTCWAPCLRQGGGLQPPSSTQDHPPAAGRFHDMLHAVQVIGANLGI